tara:strand:+ start:369 stop:758 length:390 start_codon:yes stop_codon:yes gene_type:complete
LRNVAACAGVRPAGGDARTPCINEAAACICGVDNDATLKLCKLGSDTETDGAELVRALPERSPSTPCGRANVPDDPGAVGVTTDGVAGVAALGGAAGTITGVDGVGGVTTTGVTGGKTTTIAGGEMTET